MTRFALLGFAALSLALGGCSEKSEVAQKEKPAYSIPVPLA